MRFGEIKTASLQSCCLILLFVCNLLISVSCQTGKKDAESILKPCLQLLDADDILAAGKCYSEALNSNLAQVDELSEIFGDKFYEKCVEINEKKDFKTAVVCFEGTVVLNPKSAHARFLLAKSYYEYDKTKNYSKSGDFELLDKAIESLEKGLKIKPEDAGAYGLYGDILEARQDLRKAVSKYQQAARLDESFAPGWVKLALTQEKLNDVDGAAKSYERALALKPNDALSLYYLGKIYEKKGQTDKAVALFERLFKIEPDFEDVRQRLEKLKEKHRPSNTQTKSKTAG